MSLFGWCTSGHHQLCRVEFTSSVGVTHTCACDCHHEKED